MRHTLNVFFRFLITLLFSLAVAQRVLNESCVCVCMFIGQLKCSCKVVYAKSFYILKHFVFIFPVYTRP